MISSIASMLRWFRSPVAHEDDETELAIGRVFLIGLAAFALCGVLWAAADDDCDGASARIDAIEQTGFSGSLGERRDYHEAHQELAESAADRGHYAFAAVVVYVAWEFFGFIVFMSMGVPAFIGNWRHWLKMKRIGVVKRWRKWRSGDDEG